MLKTTRAKSKHLVYVKPKIATRDSSHEENLADLKKILEVASRYLHQSQLKRKQPLTTWPKVNAFVHADK